MSTPLAFKAPFYYDAFYHLIFKSIDGLLLFRCHDNRLFFLKRFSFFLDSFLTCWAWTLLDNHAHFIVHLRSEKDICRRMGNIPDGERTVSIKKLLQEPQQELFLDELIEREVNRFMVSYVNAYNNLYKRKGGIFQSPFRRLVIAGDAHLQQAIIYTHANAQKHGLINDFRRYEYSSYYEIIGSDGGLVEKKAVLEFFGSKEQFIGQHNMQVAYYYAGDE